MRYASLFICVLALCGCKSAEQQAADRARLAANVREFCVSLGYQAGSVEAARCAEEMVKKIADEDMAGRQAGALVAAAQARNRVSCISSPGVVNCY
jgi:translation elongation factor EF-Tu-like GTPase